MSYRVVEAVHDALVIWRIDGPAGVVMRADDMPLLFYNREAARRTAAHMNKRTAGSSREFRGRRRSTSARRAAAGGGAANRARPLDRLGQVPL